MGTNQYDVEKKQLKAQAKETRRQAGILYKSGMSEAADITTDSNASLAQTIALLGKTGSLGVESESVDYAGITSGVDVGSVKGDAVTDLEKKVEKLTASVGNAETAAATATAKESDHKGSLLTNTGNGTLNKERAKLKEAQGNLTTLTQGLDKIGTITAGETASLTSGSTALNLKTFQDKLTKARNKYVNQVQEDVYSAMISAENADASAKLMGQASSWQNLNTILSIGTSAIKIAGLIKGD